MAGIDIDSEFYRIWLDTRNEAQQQVFQATADLQREATQEHLQNIAVEKLTLLKAGECVLLLPHDNSLTERRRERDKLSSFWLGPIWAVSSTDNSYTLYDTNEEREIQHHVTDLKLYVTDLKLFRSDPVKMARIDRRDFFIEGINDHRSNISRKSSLQFLLRWEGL